MDNAADEVRRRGTVKVTTARSLCIIGECYVPGAHESDCNEACSGCLPGLAMDGAYICLHHHRRGLFRLAEMPVFYDALCAGAVRRNSMVTEFVDVSGDTGLVLDEAVVESKDRILSGLTNLAAYVVTELGLTAPETLDVRALCRLLVIHANWMSSNQVMSRSWGRQLDNIARDVRPVAFRSKPSGVFLGVCPVETETGVCGARLWHDPSGYVGEKVTCRKCGTTQPLDWWRTALQPNAEAAELLTAQDLVPILAWETNHAISEDQIRQWATRGHIQRHGRDLKSRTLYRREAVLAWVKDKTPELEEAS